MLYLFTFVFFFQAEDGIRDVERSRGLGDVYKRQVTKQVCAPPCDIIIVNLKCLLHVKSSVGMALYL